MTTNQFNMITERDGKSIFHLRLNYNAFDPSQVESHEIYMRGKTTKLSTALGKLPAESEWAVAVNGVSIPKSQWEKTRIAAGDVVGVVQVPLAGGGGGAKQMLQMAAVVALSVSMIALGPGWGLASWEIAAVIGVGSMAIMFMTTPKMKGDKSDDPMLGIDGEKNTSTENIPVPVVYGEYRVAGNIADMYTKTIGNDQYLYMRTILNEGQIQSVEDIEINEQPLSNFKDVETRIEYGTDDQPVNNWFGNVTRMINKQAKLVTGSPVLHSSQTKVNRVAFNLTFPAGLANIKKSSGKKRTQTASFAFHYRKRGETAWLPLTGETIQEARVRGADFITSHTSMTSNVSSISIDTITGPTFAHSAYPDGYTVTASYRRVGTSTWTEFGRRVIRPDDYLPQDPDWQTKYSKYMESRDGFFSNLAKSVQHWTSSFSVSGLTPGSYEVKVEGGYLDKVRYHTKQSVSTLTVSAATTETLRRTFESGSLPYDDYDFRVSRTTPMDQDDEDIEDCYLIDVAEIVEDQIAYTNTAMLSLRIKVTEEIHGIPTVTARVKGSLLNIYDINGNVIDKRWTQNCAWVALDAMLDPQRGSGYDVSSIDWHSYIEWAEYCEAEGLKYNNVIKEEGNVDDFVRQVMAVGRAYPVRYGTKRSVAIDRPRTPQMVYGVGSIIPDTFSISYNSIAERANEFEVTFYDETDRNKAKVIRIVDPRAISSGQRSIVAQLDLKGVTNAEQAQKAAWYFVYNNRYLLRTVKFDVPTEAIGCRIGDVAYIAHDMVNWGWSGRLKPPTATSDPLQRRQLHLDRPITMEEGKDYSVVLHVAAAKTASGVVVNGVTGRTLNVTSSTNLTEIIADRIRSTAGDEHDYEIHKITSLGGSDYAITLKDTITGYAPTMDIYMVDRSIERDLDPQVGEVTTVTTTTLLPFVPEEFTSWMIGVKETTMKTFQLKEISGDETHRKTLTFVDYDPRIYGEPEQWVPVSSPAPSMREVSPIRDLRISWDKKVLGDNNVVNVRLTWAAAQVLNYAGADVYMSKNDDGFRQVANVPNMQEYNITLAKDDAVEFKVIPYNKYGYRANFNEAEVIGDILSLDYLGLDAPISLASSVVYTASSATLKVTWVQPDTSQPNQWDVQYRNDGGVWTKWETTDQLFSEIIGLEIANYEVRVRARLGNAVSEWSTLSVNIATPKVANAVTGLRVNGGTPGLLTDDFTGTSPTFTWNESVSSSEHKLAFKDYEVKILSAAGTVLRTEYVSVPSYTYTFEKNVQDSKNETFVARRQFRIEVRERSKYGSVSETAATMQVTNNPPAAIGGSIDTSFNFVMLTLNHPPETDIVGVRVWMESTAGDIVPSPTNLVHDGGFGTITIKATSNTAYKLAWAAYDSFNDGVNGTLAYATATTPANPAVGADFEPPAAPTGLSGAGSLVTLPSGAQQAQIDFTWAENTESDMAHYELAIKENGGNWVTFSAGLAQDTDYTAQPPVYGVPRYSLIGRVGSTYTAKIRAIDGVGNRSNWSDEVTVSAVTDTVAPSAPSNISATATFKNVFLSWVNANDEDLAAVHIYENVSNNSATATLIATVNARPGEKGGFTRAVDDISGNRYYFLKSVDTSGNVSTAFGTNASTDSNKVTLGQIDGFDIATGSIYAEHIVSGEITSDHIQAGSITGDRISTTTSLPGTITVGSTGVTIETIRANAATGAQDPATRINAGSTRIDPGKIQISGSTTLSDWRHGSDLTKIDGGNIYANTITANMLTIGLRGVTTHQLNFEANSPSNHYVSWTAGSIIYTDNDGTSKVQAVHSGNAQWTSGALYIYWTKGQNVLSTTDNRSVVYADPNNVLLAIYGGGTILNVNAGRTIIDGYYIKTGTIEANRLKANTVLAQNVYVGNTNLAINGAKFGTGKGSIVVSDGSTDRVTIGWVDANNLGINIKDSDGNIILSSATKAGEIRNDAAPIEGNLLPKSAADWTNPSQWVRTAPAAYEFGPNSATNGWQAHVNKNRLSIILTHSTQAYMWYAGFMPIPAGRKVYVTVRYAYGDGANADVGVMLWAYNLNDSNITGSPFQVGSLTRTGGAGVYRTVTFEHTISDTAAVSFRVGFNKPGGTSAGQFRIDQLFVTSHHPDATDGAVVGANLKDPDGSTLDELDVRNNVGRIISMPGGGEYRNPSTPVIGYVKITLPQSWTNTMMHFYVDIFEYKAGFARTLEIGGYNYEPNQQWWNVTARLVGETAFEYPVRFGHDGTKCAIWIGNSNTSWAYLQVRVRDLVVGHGGYSDRQFWDRGWSIGITETLGTISQTVTNTLPGAEWSKVAGAGKPANNATVGATIGSNLSGKFTEANLGNNFNAGAITGTYIKDATITNAKIANLDAGKINTGTLNAARIGANSITSSHINVAELSAISAKIGTLRTASTGQRVEIMDNKIRVYDAGNVLRVEIGELI